MLSIAHHEDSRPVPRKDQMLTEPNNPWDGIDDAFLGWQWPFPWSKPHTVGSQATLHSADLCQLVVYQLCTVQGRRHWLEALLDLNKCTACHPLRSNCHQSTTNRWPHRRMR